MLKCNLKQERVFAGLTRAGHGARVRLGTVEASLARALDGLFLRRRAVGGAFVAVGVCG